MLKILLIIPLSAFFTIIISSQVGKKNSSSCYLKILATVSLSISVTVGCFWWKLFPVQNIAGVWLYPETNLFEISAINLPLVILSPFVLLISTLLTWYNRLNSTIMLGSIFVFEIALVFAFCSTNIFIFLLLFELSSIPMFVLLVYCGSNRRERILASNYFVLFTIYGSLSLLLVIISVISRFFIRPITNGIIDNDNYYNVPVWLLLFLAMSVKIPLVPVHIWLPQAHVEASTAASMILASLMLKLGGYGIIKFLIPFSSIRTILYYQPIVVCISIIGVLYGSFCALRQIDLKRMIAFSSISHMSFSTIGIFSLTDSGVKGALLMYVSHGLISPALFFAVGVLSDRYHSRAITNYSGLLEVMPLFSAGCLIFSMANLGFPGTCGFIPELVTVISVINQFPIIVFSLLVGMLIMTSATLLLLLRILFGHPKSFSDNSVFADLTKLEFIVCAMFVVPIIFLGNIELLGFENNIFF